MQGVFLSFLKYWRLGGGKIISGQKFNLESVMDRINMMRIDTYDTLDNPVHSKEYYDNYIKENIGSITRAEGLRDKVVELLKKDIESKFKYREDIDKN